MGFTRFVVIAALFAATLIAGVAPDAAAATYTVNSTADTDDGACDLAPDCTLREAWTLANAAVGPHVIDLTGITGTVTLGSALAATLEDITLTGPGATSLTIDAGGANRAFDGIDTAVDITGLTITNGASGGLNGGCILVGAAGTLTLDASIIDSCAAGAGDGGAIASTGSAAITDSVITNSSGANGGGLWLSGDAAVSASTISGNTATTAGGGLFLSAVTGAGSLTNVTVSANDAPAGAGINLDGAGVGAWTIMSSTIANNLTSDGFTENAAITATIQNSIFAGNAANDCTGTGINTDGGGNVIVTNACGAVTPASTVDPALSALGNYGGPVPTHEITVGSSAIDIGIAGGAPAVDARGASRPVDGDTSTTAEHDAGAFEYGPLSAVSDIDPVNFGSIVVGVTSGVTQITVTNDGNQVWTTPSLQLTNTTDFAINAETCTAGPIDIGATCTIDLETTPSTTGGLTGAVEMSNDGGLSWLTLAGMNVTGTAASIAFTPATDPHDFGEVDLAGNAAQTFTITNAGTAVLNITTVAIGGANAADYVISADTCTGAAVASGGGTCTFDVTFTPGATGARTATITATSDAPSSPDTLGLTGVGAEPTSTVTPASPHAFGTVSTGTLQQVTISILPANTLPLDVTAINLSNTLGTAFSAGAPSCGALPQTITAPATCDVVVTLDTASAGTFAADVSISTSDPNNSPQTVSLTATVAATAPAPSIAPATWSPTTTVGTPASQTVTLSNGAGATADLTTIAVALAGAGAAEYSIINDTCTGATVTAGNSCTFDISFDPGSAATFNATASVTNNGTTQTVTLTGTGTAAPTNPIPSITPTTWSPSATVGGSTSQSFTLTNGAGATADLTTIAIALSGAGAAGFATANDTCTGATLTPGQTCTFDATFSPTLAATYAATLTVTSNGTAQTATLSGTGTAAASGTPSASLSTTSIDFGNVSTGNVLARAFSLINDSSATDNLTVSAVSVTGSTEYRIDNETCTAAPVAPGGACTVVVTYTPAATASASGTVSISSNDAASPHSVTLTGTGITGPSLTLTPTSVDFATAMVGDTEAITVTVGVSGTGTVTGIAPVITGTGFSSLADTCASASLSGTDTCVVIVGFTPTATGSAVGSLTITATNATSASAPVTGTGIAQVADDNGTTTDNGTITDNKTLIGGTDDTSSIAGATGCSAANGATGTPILLLLSIAGLAARIRRTTTDTTREESA